jgi:ATP adenylyltransferase
VSLFAATFHHFHIMDTPHLNFDHARTPEQIALMKRINEDGVCPFCAEHFRTYHPRPILKETENWFVTTNMNPYEGTKYHFLFVYKPAHILEPHDMTPEAQHEIFALVAEVVDAHHIKGGAFFMRFGDTHYNGSSVAHLHAHVIVGDVDAPDHEPVRVKLG